MSNVERGMSENEFEKTSSPRKTSLARRDFLLTSASVLSATAISGSGAAASTEPAAAPKTQPTPNTITDLDRTSLPIAEPTYPPITELDARNAKAPPIFEVKAPAGAPNVIVILLDNFGYAGSKTMGAYQLADAGSPRQEWADLQQFPREPDLLGDPRVVSDRPQLP